MNANKRIDRMRLLLIALGLAALTASGSLLAQSGSGETDAPARAELDREPAIALDPAAGGEIGLVFEAYLSPHQEGGEEEDTPGFVPGQFRSTMPSVPRDQRPSRGHAVLEFTRDLSRAYVSLAVEGVKLDELVMLHLHCGRPGQLGPIIVDFARAGDIHEYLSDGVLYLEITNADLEAVLDHSHGLIDGFTSGCPIVPNIPTDKVRTIAGMAQIAGQTELYFNLHTAGQTYFGDIRGQFYPVESGR
jgi:hypothetical protein